MTWYGGCPCGSGLPVNTAGGCERCNQVRYYTAPLADDQSLAAATVRVEKLVGGYIVQVGYGRAEVFEHLEGVLKRVAEVLR